MWKLVKKSSLVNGDNIALLKDGVLLMEGKVIKSLSNGTIGLWAEDKIVELPSTTLNLEFKDETGSYSVYSVLTNAEVEDDSYEFYKWEPEIPKFNLQEIDKYLVWDYVHGDYNYLFSIDKQYPIESHHNTMVKVLNNNGDEMLVSVGESIYGDNYLI